MPTDAFGDFSFPGISVATGGRIMSGPLAWGFRMPLVLTVTQEADLAVAAQDARGNAAEVSDPRWSSSDESVLGVVASSDGMSAIVRAAGATGNAQVVFRCDADLGEGVVELMGTLDVEVVAGQAVTVSVAAGAPREQAPPA